jgi:hypothetical protein
MVYQRQNRNYQRIEIFKIINQNFNNNNYGTN